MKTFDELSKLNFDSYIYHQAYLDDISGKYLDNEQIDQLEIYKIVRDIINFVPVKQGDLLDEKVSLPNGYVVWEGNHMGRYMIETTE